jgi:hypothetical protein
MTAAERKVRLRFASRTGREVELTWPSGTASRWNVIRETTSGAFIVGLPGMGDEGVRPVTADELSWVELIARELS